MSLFPEAIPVGKVVVIDDIPKYVHHMDDQGGWEDTPVMHSLFDLVGKLIKEKWQYEFGHLYESALVTVSCESMVKMNLCIVAATT